MSIEYYCVLQITHYNRTICMIHRGTRLRGTHKDVGGDTMMSHFVRGRSNAIDWLEFRNLLISYLRVRHELELGTG